MKAKSFKYTKKITNKYTNLKIILTKLRKKNIFLIKLNQTHSSNIAIIEKKNESNKLIIKNSDAIITNLLSSAIAIRTADCLPILITHESGWYAAIHAGRKGTETNITKKTLHQLITKTQSKENYTIYFGPHICETCYEIDHNKKIHYNLLKKNINQLKSLINLKKSMLKINTSCTSCNKKYHSYRKDNKTKKRNFNILEKLLP